MTKRLAWPLVVVCAFCLALGCQGGGTTSSARPERKPEPTRPPQVRNAASSTAAVPESPGSLSDHGPAGVARRGMEAPASLHAPLELSPEEVQRLGIATARVAYHPLRAVHAALGRVSAPPPRMAKVSYPFPARISGVHVNLGDWVEKGQPVLTLQSEEVGRARSEYYKAVADLELAKQNFERERRLAGRGVGPRKHFLAAEAALKVAQAGLQAAEKKLLLLGFSETDLRALTDTHQVHPEIMVLAPIRGRVIEHKAVLGMTVDQTSELMTLMDPTVVWVEAEVFERDIPKVRVGQDVVVSVLAYPGQIFRGKVTYVGDTIHPETRTLSVRTEVPNPELKLKHGMFADVRIVLNDHQRVLMVPPEAVLEDNNQKIVFVKTEAGYAVRVVTVGGRQDGMLAITEGLRAGEQVVVSNAYLLKSKLYDQLLKSTGVH